MTLNRCVMYDQVISCFNYISNNFPLVCCIYIVSVTCGGRKVCRFTFEPAVQSHIHHVLHDRQKLRGEQGVVTVSGTLQPPAVPQLHHQTHLPQGESLQQVAPTQSTHRLRDTGDDTGEHSRGQSGFLSASDLRFSLHLTVGLAFDQWKVDKMMFWCWFRSEISASGHNLWDYVSLGCM